MERGLTPGAAKDFLRKHLAPAFSRRRSETEQFNPEKVWNGLSSQAKHIAVAMSHLYSVGDDLGVLLYATELPEANFDAGWTSLQGVDAIERISQHTMDLETIARLSSRFEGRYVREIDQTEQEDWSQYNTARSNLSRHSEFSKGPSDPYVNPTRFRLVPPFKSFLSKRFGDPEA
jgi:hypothetical protein